MSAVTITQMANRVAGLLEERLGARGKALDDKVRRAGRKLPRRVRSAAEALASASVIAANPKLLAQLDEGVVAEAYDVCVRHLNGIDRSRSRRDALIATAASVAFSLLVVAAGIAAYLYWRGYV